MPEKSRSPIPIWPPVTNRQSDPSPSMSGAIVEDIKKYFARYGRPRYGSRLLIALSGGPDSVALLAALILLKDEYDWSLGAAHVNYRLRGE